MESRCTKRTTGSGSVYIAADVKSSGIKHAGQRKQRTEIARKAISVHFRAFNIPLLPYFRIVFSFVEGLSSATGKSISSFICRSFNCICVFPVYQAITGKKQLR